MDMAGKRGGKKTHGRVVRRAAWRTDRSFRVPRPRARGTRGRTACRWPGRRTGPPAAHPSDDRLPYCRGIAARMRNGSIEGSIPAIFPGNIETTAGFLRSARRTYRPEYRSSRKKSRRWNRPTKTAIGAETSIIAASIGERFHPIPDQAAKVRAQRLDLNDKYSNLRRPSSIRHKISRAHPHDPDSLKRYPRFRFYATRPFSQVDG